MIVTYHATEQAVRVREDTPYGRFCGAYFSDDMDTPHARSIARDAFAYDLGAAMADLDIGDWQGAGI